MGSMDFTPKDQSKPFKVLIAGGGIVGLTIAQGCRENGIPFEVLERDTSGSRRQGWALTLHWCLRALQRTIGPKRSEAISKAVVDHTLTNDAGNFLFLNAATCGVKYRIPPSKQRLRLHREKLREALVAGLEGYLHEGKKVIAVETLNDGGVKAVLELTDGSRSSVEGTLLIGADGSNSVVRKFLLPNNYELTRLPVALVGVVRRFSPEQAAPVRGLDPLLFQALDPSTGNYLWYSVQAVHEDGDGKISTDALVIISWLVKDEVADAIPATHEERIREMKRRAAGFAEPLRSIVMDIPDDLGFTTPLRLADFPCRAWDNRRGRVTLAGDSAHAMTMFRGEGANHGILDAALLVDQLKRVKNGEVDQIEALGVYEKEVQERTKTAVLLSRRAALDAHEWDKVNDASPVIGARTAPALAFL